MKKRYLIFLSVAAAAAAAGTGVAASWLSDADAAENKLTPGGVNTSITEEFEDPGIPDPGEVIEKSAAITNNGPNACYVRAAAYFSESDMEELCEVDYNTGSWQYSGGWWYYGDILEADETTAPLFTAVKVSDSAAPEEIHAFDIYIVQESRQAEGNESCFAAWGGE